METVTIEQGVFEYFRQKMPNASGLRLTDFRLASEGWSDETILLELEWIESNEKVKQGYVLRRYKKGLSGDSSNIEKQFKILQVLSSKSDIPVAQPYWYEEDHPILKGPFFVMGKLKGKSFVPWSMEGKQFFKEAYEKGLIPKQFVRYLADLHLLDYKKNGFSEFLLDPGPDTAFIEKKLAIYERQYEEFKVSPDPILTDAIKWLHKNKPKAQRLSLIHGDYRTGNMMYESNRITGILDWEVAEIGDPMSDVGYVCAKANRMDSPLLCYMLDRDDFLSWYGEMAGIEVNKAAVHYYEVFHQVRFLFISMKAYHAFNNGVKDLRLARQGYRCALMRDMLAKLIGY